MKICEVVEASYPGNIGFFEMVQFFQKANPREEEEMDRIVKNNDWDAFKKLIKKVLGVKLQGAQFEGEEEITELESPEALNDRLTKELKKLRIELTQAGYTSSDINTALNRSAVRLAKEKAQKFGKFGSSIDQKPVVKKPTKVYHIENATAGATSAGNIASIANPHLSPGKARGNKSFTGTPGKSGTKSPPQPKVVQQKNPDGSIKGAHDVGGNLFGGGTIKRK